MKCPLFIAGAESTLAYHKKDDIDCIKEECAWWQGDDNVCWFVQIGISLSIIATELIAIRMRMPHEEQFRK